MFRFYNLFDSLPYKHSNLRVSCVVGVRSPKAFPRRLVGSRGLAFYVQIIKLCPGPGPGYAGSFKESLLCIPSTIEVLRGSLSQESVHGLRMGFEFGSLLRRIESSPFSMYSLLSSIYIPSSLELLLWGSTDGKGPGLNSIYSGPSPGSLSRGYVDDFSRIKPEKPD
jgi:hypothetical protein